MKIFYALLATILTDCVAFAQHDEHAAETFAIGFKEGSGLLVCERTAKAMGLETAEVTERAVQHELDVVAQVFELREQAAIASAMIPSSLRLQAGDELLIRYADRDDTAITGKVERVDAALSAQSNQAEVIIAMPQSELPVEPGDFVHAKTVLADASLPVVAVPASAVLGTIYGDFVFVENGGTLLRVPVKTGASNSEWIEITDGLFSGDRVAVRPVEWLYLAELRLTKGGAGCCH